MTRAELEKNLGKKVRLRLFDDEVITGVLRKTGEDIFKNQPNLYIPKKLYFLTDNIHSTICKTCLFKVSHIKILKEIN